MTTGFIRIWQLFSNREDKEVQGKQTKERELLIYDVIESAVSGDMLAVSEVVEHYRNYILKLSTRKYVDSYGKVSYVVDEVLRGNLENKLMIKILNFKL
ncbi:helix-turn-helix domain-containing protein [Ruminococcus sp. AM45-9BH]|jgi:hypothetical protein|nr:helix-turn-helix domain-containing protein [Ruminococcus sp. AM45-9BH]RHS72175.1 helix-turn-helix domain-containing protein [Ruminococcus sp. AM44-9AT]RHS77706.1 helix-turn-helix domain-containing protein [Ruminococcus sp. AM45-2]RHT14568.1 helix-turn-helix domain-containing protein [Ruminococcus sp. AM34-9LB]